MTDSTTSGCTLGVHIAAGTAYVAVVDCPDVPRFDDPLERLQVGVGVELAEQMTSFANRFKQELRRIRPRAVGVVFPKLYSQWKYADAFKRVSLETAIILATEELSTPAQPMDFVQVKQDSMAKAIGIPLPKMDSEGRKRWGDGIPHYRKERIFAFAAATTLAQRYCP